MLPHQLRVLTFQEESGGIKEEWEVDGNTKVIHSHSLTALEYKRSPAFKEEINSGGAITMLLQSGEGGQQLVWQP